MKAKKIIQKEHSLLRKKAHEIPPKDIPGRGVQALIRNMKESLATREHGVALAAPQIGISKRVFVVAPHIFEEEYRVGEPLVYINPVIIKRSRKKAELDEGCLSVSGYYGTVKRHERVTIEAYDEKGRRFNRGGSGLLAQIFQHEVDHLDGILYTDKAVEVHEVDEHENG